MVRAISLGPLLAGASAFQHQACRRRILPFLLPIEASNLVAGRQRSSLMFATNVGDMETKTSADDENTIPVLLESEAATKFMDNERSTGFVVESYSSATDTALLVAVEAPSSESWVDSPLLWKGVVAILCGLWASNFAAAKLIMAEPGVDSSLYCVSRFSIAALCLAPFAISSARRVGLDKETLRGAAACGSWVAFGYIGQILGLLTTTASRSCVICSLHCVFVAVVAEMARSSRRPSGSPTAAFDTKRLGPAALAVIGVAIVELQGAAGAPNIGDLLSFAQPIGFGMGYLQLEELMRRRPETAMTVSAIKLAVVALVSLCLFEVGPLFASVDLTTPTTAIQAISHWSPQIPHFGAILDSPVALGGILYTGLITTALALWVESIAFAKVPATDASIILTTEPLFAAALGAVTLGETFGMSDYAGASLIVGACVLAALMDNPGDEECVVEEDPSCEPPRKWPFWGF